MPCRKIRRATGLSRSPSANGAADRIRTGDVQLGKARPSRRRGALPHSIRRALHLHVGSIDPVRYPTVLERDQQPEWERSSPDPRVLELHRNGGLASRKQACSQQRLQDLLALELLYPLVPSVQVHESGRDLPLRHFGGDGPDVLDDHREGNGIMPDDLVELGKDGDIGAIARLERGGKGNRGEPRATRWERDRYLNSGGK